jgi:hypothetical protein
MTAVMELAGCLVSVASAAAIVAGIEVLNGRCPHATPGHGEVMAIPLESGRGERRPVATRQAMG